MDKQVRSVIIAHPQFFMRLFILATFVCMGLCYESMAQRRRIDYSSFEYTWCRPHPSYKTQFAKSDYELSFIPVSFNISAELYGLKTFYHLSLSSHLDSIISPESLFNYYTRCFDGFIDTVFFRGPTLYSLRLCRNQTPYYICIQYANQGEKYYLTVIEAARHTQHLTSAIITEKLYNNEPVVYWLTGARADTTLRPPDLKFLSELAASLKANPDLRIDIVSHTDGEGNRRELIDLSRLKGQFVYHKLVKLGMERSRAGYSGYGPDFPIESNNTCLGRSLNNRIVISRKL